LLQVVKHFGGEAASEMLKPAARKLKEKVAEWDALLCPRLEHQSIEDKAWESLPFQQRRQLHSVQGVRMPHREPVTYHKTSQFMYTGLPNSRQGRRGAHVPDRQGSASVDSYKKRLGFDGDMFTTSDGQQVQIEYDTDLSLLCGSPTLLRRQNHDPHLAQTTGWCRFA